MYNLTILVFNWRDPLHPEAGGAEVHLDRILSYLSQKHRVILVSTKTQKNEEKFSHNGYEVQRIGHPQLFHMEFPRLFKRFKDLKIDCIIDDISKIGLRIPYFVQDIPVLSIFHHVHGHTLFQLLPLPLALYVYLAEKWALKFYKKAPMIVVSESTKNELMRLADFQNITILHNGIDQEFLLPFDRFSKTPLQFCSIGRLTKAKRVDLAIECFYQIQQKYPQACLKIAGKGSEEQSLKKLVSKLGLDTSVEFCGFISDQDKISLLTQSEAMLFTSEKEGWGITAIEASACGTPVFAFDVEGVRDSVQHGVNGFLCPFNDKEKFINLIDAYMQLPALNKQALQSKAYCYAMNFSWDRIAQEFELLLYNQL